MKFLRTLSTHRLLAIVAGLAIAAIGGTAIAVAAATSGPVPKPESLADAIHQGLGAGTVAGVTADITFTNHVIPASNLQGSGDPLLSGGSGQLWFSPSQHRLRIALFSTGGAADPQIVVNGRSFWISDPSNKTVYSGTLPASTGPGTTDKTTGPDTIPSLGQIQSYIAKLLKHVDLNGVSSGQPGATPGDVGGQPTYSVRVTPKHSGGLLGAAQIAWDAANGVPLDFAIYASNDPSPVLELAASNISFGAVPASDFTIAPPAGSHTVTVATADRSAHTRQAHPAPISGVSAVAASLPFSLAAPSTAAGLSRQAVKELNWGGKRAALITYGQGIGAVAVIERPAKPGSGSSSTIGSSIGQRDLTLPAVSIDGNTAHELGTALGTALMFTHNGVSYTVIGSVPATAADLAATDIAKSIP